MCLSKNYVMPFLCKWPSPGLNKQSWCWKKFSLMYILIWHSHTKRQAVDFFYHHDLAQILFISMCSAADHMMLIFAFLHVIVVRM